LSSKETQKASIKIESSMEKEKSLEFSVTNATDMPKTEPIDDEECVANQIDVEPSVEPEKNEAESNPKDEKLVKRVRQIECPICKSTVLQFELEYHMNLHVLSIEVKSKPTSKLPYTQLPPGKDGKKRFQCQFEGCRAVLKTQIRQHMVRKGSDRCLHHRYIAVFFRPSTFRS
jgi:hypothetical protein